DVDGVQIALHGAEAFADYSFPPVAESNLTHLYFRIPDQAEFLERIRHAGTPLIAVDEVAVTVEDPDGRKAMFGTARGGAPLETGAERRDPDEHAGGSALSRCMDGAARK